MIKQKLVQIEGIFSSPQVPVVRCKHIHTETIQDTNFLTYAMKIYKRKNCSSLRRRPGRLQKWPEQKEKTEYCKKK